MKKWLQEQSFAGIYIKIDNGAKTPVAVVAVPIGWRENPKWEATAERKANFITAAPLMYAALIKVKEAMNLEGSEEVNFEDLYKIVDNALNEAGYENKESD